MRTVRRVVILAMLTVTGTFMPPYPSNANFPPSQPAQTTVDDGSPEQPDTSADSELPAPGGYYTLHHR